MPYTPRGVRNKNQSPSKNVEQTSAIMNVEDLPSLERQETATFEAPFLDNNNHSINVQYHLHEYYDYYYPENLDEYIKIDLNLAEFEYSDPGKKVDLEKYYEVCHLPLCEVAPLRATYFFHIYHFYSLQRTQKKMLTISNYSAM